MYQPSRQDIATIANADLHTTREVIARDEVTVAELIAANECLEIMDVAA